LQIFDATAIANMF